LRNSFLVVLASEAAEVFVYFFSGDVEAAPPLPTN
jgi:hypothetical protein